MLSTLLLVQLVYLDVVLSTQTTTIHISTTHSQIWMSTMTTITPTHRHQPLSNFTMLIYLQQQTNKLLNNAGYLLWTVVVIATTQHPIFNHRPTSHARHPCLRSRVELTSQIPHHADNR